ncbi:sensor histidine kinase [Chitinophagaceae bacterium MMS25-I14]
MQSKNREIIIHVICCIAFLTVPLYFEPGPDNHAGITFNSGTIRDLFGYFLTLVFFYLNYYLFIPGYFFKKRYVTFTLFTLVCFGLVTVLPVLLFHVTPEHHHFGPPHDMGHMPPQGPGGGADDGPGNHSFFIGDISHNIWRFSVVFAVSLLLKINAQLKLTQKEKLNAELSYLKAQINPHFLFNTLNSIYVLAIEQSKNTADAILQLSGMMRYVISEANHDFVPLERELNYIRSYIKLQELRLGNTVQLFFEVTGSPIGKKITPLTLIPFIENAFKHGVNPEENSDIRIRIVIDERILRMDVVNNKVQVVQAEEEKSGLGIENTRGRLQVLYPGKHLLTIKDDAKEYSVSLILEL